MGKSQQQKGRRAEIEFSNLLQERGINVKAGDPCNHGRTPDVTGLKGVHIEIKRHEKLNIYAALRQAAKDAARFGDGLPIVAHRANRCPWVISMDLDTFIAFYERTKTDKTG